MLMRFKNNCFDKYNDIFININIYILKIKYDGYLENIPLSLYFRIIKYYSDII
jgi:hypothetical protein